MEYGALSAWSSFAAGNTEIYEAYFLEYNYQFTVPKTIDIYSNPRKEKSRTSPERVLVKICTSESQPRYARHCYHTPLSKHEE